MPSYLEAIAPAQDRQWATYFAFRAAAGHDSIATRPDEGRRRAFLNVRRDKDGVYSPAIST